MPFPADPAARERTARLAAVAGPAVVECVRGGRIRGGDVASLVRRFDLDGPLDALLLALPAAAALADPPISRFRVGAAALEIPSGDVVLGGNLEFPGLDLVRTLHAEGVVAIRAFLDDASLAAIAVPEARPCAFCRQTLVEFAWAPELRLVDPLGHDLSLQKLYPWPFTPADLDAPGVIPGAVPWPELSLPPDGLPTDVAGKLVEIGRRAHAPYSGCPAAVVLRLRDGRLVAGASLENVAFDPSVGPLQTALAVLRSAGDGYAAIESAFLAAPDWGVVDDVRITRDLLAVVAPGVALTTTAWN